MSQTAQARQAWLTPMSTKRLCWTFASAAATMRLSLPAWTGRFKGPGIRDISLDHTANNRLDLTFRAERRAS